MANNVSKPKQTLAAKLEKLLNDGVGEREGLAPFVKQYPQVLKDALLRYEGGLVRGVAEFRFGNEFRADFVLLTAFSGGFIVKIVELESSTDNLLNKNGKSMTSRFNHAYSQIQSWKEYARSPSKGALGVELERQFREHEALRPDLRGKNPIDNTTKYPLSHPECLVCLEYAIVIGRRHALTSTEVARKGTLMIEQIEVVSWDRLLDAARAFLPSGKRIPPAPYVPPTPEEQAALSMYRELLDSITNGGGQWPLPPAVDMQ